MESPEEVKNNFEDILKAAVELKVTDVHIQSGEPVLFRNGGLLYNPFKEEVILTDSHILNLESSIFNLVQKQRYDDAHSLDMSYELEGSRFRVNFAQERGKPYLAIRVIPNKIREIKDIGFPNETWKDIVGLERGLVLVTGVTGSGKSTTLASLIQEINRNSQENIITLEDPVEYIHHRIKSSVKQRELYRDVLSFADGVEQAMRQDPDIILIGEIRDFRTASSALIAAETGHLVFSTLHTKDAKSTISRFVDLFPVQDKDQVRAALAENLSYLLCQQLVPYEREGKRAVAMEILKNNGAIKNLIRSDQVHQISTAIQTGSREGMVTMDKSLENLCRAGRITPDNAIKYAIDREAIVLALSR